MEASYFVDEDSVVRKIWGKSDTILFIFAGASAEFALNRAVDWLYFTGRIPRDPIGRLFSTVSYARAIVFSKSNAAFQTIDAMTSIHAQVEVKRESSIPQWAYHDVLFMLIDYSIRSFETLERSLSREEKNEVFQVFIKLGNRMKLIGLPQTFADYENMRKEHLEKNLKYSSYTHDLFSQYRKHLGMFRYFILKEVQRLVVPDRVRGLLALKKILLFYPVIYVYKVIRKLNLDDFIKAIILPPLYREQIKALDK